MSIKILIVEDEDLYASQLEMLVEKMEYEHIGTIDNSKDVLNRIDKNVPDIILMDVHIQGEYDGIELAEMILKKHTIPIIFITSLQDDMTFKRATRVQPFGFLLKPFTDIQLQRQIELCVKKLVNQNTEEVIDSNTEHWKSDILFKDALFIKTGKKLDKVLVKDMLFLEVEGHYCKVQTERKKYLVRMSLSELNDKLPKQLFFQTHRSFLVNLSKVKSVDLENSVVIIGEHEIALSKRNREKFLQLINYIS